MEREPSYNMTYGPSLTLYREDIERILLLFREHCERVSILDRQCQYESLQELENKKGQFPKVLYIMGENPYAEFSIDPANANKVWLYIARKGGGENLYFKIKQILDSRENLIGKILTPITSLAVAFIVAVFLYIFISNDVIKLLGIISLTLLAVIAFLIAEHIKVGGFSSIQLGQKLE